MAFLLIETLGCGNYILDPDFKYLSTGYKKNPLEKEIDVKPVMISVVDGQLVAIEDECWLALGFHEGDKEYNGDFEKISLVTIDTLLKDRSSIKIGESLLDTIELLDKQGEMRKYYLSPMFGLKLHSDVNFPPLPQKSMPLYNRGI